jgi:hypothetical protein
MVVGWRLNSDWLVTSGLRWFKNGYAMTPIRGDIWLVRLIVDPGFKETLVE